MDLKSQLNKLKNNQKSLPNLPYKSSPSLLFDYKYSNIIGIDEIYEIGYEGLIELSKIDDKFIKYLKLLFSSTSKYFNRELITEKETKNIDQILKSLLIELSDYFTNKNSHQVLEYLIKVYKINLYLVDDIFFSYLCYCNNHIFIRLIQNINYNENKLWSFIENYAINGLIIPNEIIFKYCSSNYEFMNKLLVYYLENISITNENYFYFILDIIKYKLDNLNSFKNENEKNLFQLIIKVINYINKNYSSINNNEYKIILSYYQALNLFLNKINLESDYLKGILNDLINNVLSYIQEQSSFNLIINILSLICKNYNSFHNNDYIFNEESIKSFSDKYAVFNDEINYDNAITSNIEYLAYELIIYTISNNNFSLIKDFLCTLFNNEIIIENTLNLLIDNNKKIKNWTLIEDLNSNNFNLAFISLYKKNKINNIPFKNNNLNIYFNLISSSVPQL